MKFRYAKYGQTFRPVIPIKLKNKGQEIGYHILVDSGADLCIFDAEIGEAIGINVKSGAPREVFGVGGKSSFYYLHNVSIDVGGWEYHIEAGFMPNVAGHVMPYGVVGQKGFFEHFKAIFEQVNEEIKLRRKT